MKKIITLLILMFSTLTIAQQHNNFRLNDIDHFNIYVLADPVASIKDGLNIGAGFEYVGPIYAGVQYRIMPVLEDGYKEIVGNVGLPFISGYDGDWEYRAGVSLGFVKRYDWSPTFAFEVGLSKKINDNVYIFCRGGFQNREDFEMYGADSKWQKRGDLGVGFKL